MTLLSSFSKAWQTLVDDINTPKSFKTGERFEDYVRKYLFVKDDYELVEQTHNYQTNKRDFVEASVKPDFRFRDRATKREFYVEAKFRSGTYQGKIEWCKPFQLKRYQEYNAQLPVFLLLGIGGTPNMPDALALIPLSEAKYTGLFPNYVQQFEIKLEKPVPSKFLWRK